MARDLDRISDSIVKVHLLKSLYVRGRWPAANRKLRNYLKADAFAVRAEAALVLASPEIGNVELVKPILLQLKREPTERGRRAATYLEMDDMLSKLEKYAGLEKTNEILKLRDREIQSLKAKVAELKTNKPEGGAGASASTPGGKLFEELFERVQRTYVDAKKTKSDDLIDAAAKGLVNSLDPFSAYMNERQLTEFNSSIQQRYGGIGAVVQMDRKTGFLTIQRPIYGNPAFTAGLRTLDQITKVEGVSTKGKTVGDLVKILKGPENTAVRVWVKPFLNREVKNPVSITRRSITLKSVTWDMLPGNIGYMALSQFGYMATMEVEAALQDLEKRGMQGLIFDLRGNPGGLLSAAVEIADKFLPDDKLVVYSEGRKGTRYGARQEDGGRSVRARRLAQPQHPNYPLILLIDDNSASASEIVAGALQAHKRAVLVGEQTFGKGSVQNIFPLRSMNNKAALRMTIAYYYLPDGRLIHRPREVETWRFRERMRREISRWQREGQIKESEAKELLKEYSPEPGGVEPDYQVKNPEIEMALQRAFGLIFEKQLVEAYIQTNWLQNKALFHELAKLDGFDEKRYPNFDGLWKQVVDLLDDAAEKTFTKNDLRRLVRASVRRFAQDDLARVLTSDYQEDHQMQAAMLLLAEKMGTSVDAIGALKFVRKNFPKGVKRTRNPVAKKAPEKKGDGRDFK